MLATTLTPRDKMAAGRLFAVENVPYMRAAIWSLVPREVNDLNTVAVTKNGILLWDAKALERWTPKEVAGALIHECFHWILKHHERCEILSADPKLFNFAGDIAINQEILKAGVELPPNCLLPKTYNFPESLTTEEYYRKLVDLREQQCPQCGQLLDPKQQQGKGKKKGKSDPNQQGQDQDGGKKGKSNKKSKGQGQGQGQDAGDSSDGHSHGDHGQEGNGEGDGQGDGNGNGQSGSGHTCQSGPAVGAGWCGSVAGRRVDGEPQDGDPDGRKDAEMGRIRRQVAEDIRREAQRGRGTIPEGLVRWADSILQPPKIPWQQKLARITRRAVSSKAGMVNYSYERPSRRQGGLGYGEGIPIMPTMRAPYPKVSVGIDTSGSMDSECLTAAVRETAGILQAIGARICFLSCDAEVHEIKDISNPNELRKYLRGGGGTDFRPVFDAIEKQKGGPPSIFIFITDGQGPAPAEPPARTHVIWLLVGKYRTSPCSWGEQIECED